MDSEADALSPARDRGSPVPNEDPLFSDSDSEGGGNHKSGTLEECGRDRDKAQTGGSDNENENEKSQRNEEKEKKARGRVSRRQVVSEEMLTGPNGLSKLPVIFKDFKFGGRTRAEEDLSIILSKLEHWAHLLHPIQPFDQCLQRTEVLGMKRKVIKTYMKKIRMNLVGDDDTFTNEDNMDIEENSNEPTLSSSFSFPQCTLNKTEETDTVAGTISGRLEEPIADEEVLLR